MINVFLDDLHIASLKCYDINEFINNFEESSWFYLKLEKGQLIEENIEKDIESLVVQVNSLNILDEDILEIHVEEATSFMLSPFLFSH